MRSDYKAVETASKQSVAFKTVPPVEGVCAPKYEDCLHLYADAEGCHYTCKTVTK